MADGALLSLHVPHRTGLAEWILLDPVGNIFRQVPNSKLRAFLNKLLIMDSQIFTITRLWSENKMMNMKIRVDPGPEFSMVFVTMSSLFWYPFLPQS